MLDNRTYFQIGWSKQRAAHWQRFLGNHELAGEGHEHIATLWVGRRYDIDSDGYRTCVIVRGKIIARLPVQSQIKKVA